MGPILKLATLALVVLLSACSADVSTSEGSAEVSIGGAPTADGLSAQQAVILARGQVSDRAELLRAETGGIGEFDEGGGVSLPEVPRDRVVWAVDFRDVVDFPCPYTPDGPPSGCGIRPAMVRIVLDYWTGELLYGVNTALE